MTAKAELQTIPMLRSDVGRSCVSNAGSSAKPGGDILMGNDRYGIYNGHWRMKHSERQLFQNVRALLNFRKYWFVPL